MLRKCDAYLRAAFRRARHGNCAAVQLHGAPRDGQPEAAAARFGREERLENLVMDPHGNSWSRIVDVETTGIGHLCEPGPNGPSAPHRLCGVDQQVQERGPKQGTVARERNVRTLDVDLHVLCGWIPAHGIDCIHEEQTQLDWFQAQRARAGEDEEILHQLVEGIDPVDDVAHDREEENEELRAREGRDAT